MEEVFIKSWLSNLFGGSGGLDWPTTLGLFVVALIYFLAPTAGYVAERRGLLLATLWVLVGKVAVMMLKTALLFFEVLDTRMNSRLAEGGALFMLLTMLEGGLFILALILFVSGLAALRRSDDPTLNFERRTYRED